jgi:hypothetical protein
MSEINLDFFKQKGKEGGKATAKKHGKKHFSSAGKIGMQKRWAGHEEKEKETK